MFLVVVAAYPSHDDCRGDRDFASSTLVPAIHAILTVRSHSMVCDLVMQAF